MKTFKFSLMLPTRENTDVFITLDENIYGIHRKKVNILYLFIYLQLWISALIDNNFIYISAFSCFWLVEKFHSFLNETKKSGTFGKTQEVQQV